MLSTKLTILRTQKCSHGTSEVLQLCTKHASIPLLLQVLLYLVDLPLLLCCQLLGCC
jgi:hypothetical protein